jgi:hypothetical protein
MINDVLTPKGRDYGTVNNIEIFVNIISQLAFEYLSKTIDHSSFGSLSIGQPPSE